jgi:hypothetical protein
MSFLLSLVDVVATEIWTCWLEVADIPRLDSAACWGGTRRTQRRAMLACLYSRTTVYKTAHLLNSFNRRTADGFTRWLFSRNVRVDGIYISPTFLREHDQGTRYLQRCGKSIKTIFAEEMHPSSLYPTTPIKRFCRLCLNVVEFTCPHDFTFAEYQEIAQAWPKLTSIVFNSNTCIDALMLFARRCRKLVHVGLGREGFFPMIAKAQFICALPNTIETLDLGSEMYSDIFRSSPEASHVCLATVFRTATLPRLRSVTGELMRELTDEAVRALAQRCSLQSIHLCGSGQLTQAAYITLSRHCQLQEICITDGNKIGPNALLALLLGSAPSLRKFSLKGGGCTTDMLLTLGRYCVFLEELRVEEIRDILPIDGWEALAHGCPKLVALQTLGDLVSEDGLCAIVECCRKLRTLKIEGSVLTDRTVRAIALHGCQLVTLRLTTTCAVSDDSLCAVVSACSRLKTLMLGVACTDKVLLTLAEHCADLRFFYLISPHHKDTGVTDIGVTALVTRFHKLRVLWLEGADVTDAVLPVIAANSKLLRELHVRDCPAVTASNEGTHKLLFAADVFVVISNFFLNNQE